MAASRSWRKVEDGHMPPVTLTGGWITCRRVTRAWSCCAKAMAESKACSAYALKSRGTRTCCAVMVLPFLALVFWAPLASPSLQFLCQDGLSRVRCLEAHLLSLSVRPTAGATRSMGTAWRDRLSRDRTQCPLQWACFMPQALGCTDTAHRRRVSAHRAWGAFCRCLSQRADLCAR